MSTTVAVKNTMLDAVTINKIRIHTGVTTDGTQNTITKTTTGLAEAACTYGAASSGSRDLTGAVLIEDLPAAITVSHYSLWNGTTFLGTKPFVSSEDFTGAGGKSNITTAPFDLTDAA